MDRIEKISLADLNSMYAARKIRYEVFCLEQKVSAEGDWDNKVSENYLFYSDGTPCATIRYRKIGKCFKIERLCVLKAYRNRGIARMLMQRVISDIRKSSKAKIILHAQTYVLQFYLSLGFKPQGKEFFEEGIAHYSMTRED
ncbi:MAG: GNAT family N-acetyltransferase [Bacteroidales bacterium]|nr:GNAT family N-acetyltransferase [Bacteroidales bacterium]